MKKFTKILSLVLAVSLIVSLFTVNVMAATQRTATIKIYDSCDVDTRQEITTAKAGDTICVEITVDDTKNLEQIGYAMSYDADAFVADLTLDSDEYETYLDADWYYEHFENKKGDYKDWFNTFGTPSFTPSSTATGVKGVMNFQWAAESGLATSYENFIIGKFELTVADDANGKYSFSFVESNETTVTTTAGEDWSPFVANTATLTVGEEEKVVEIGTVSGATEAGAAVKPEYGTHKYDNAYVVTVNLTNEKNGDVVGVEFIPTEVLKYAGITEASTEDEINAVWATSAAKTTFGAVLGEGKAEYKAALINIPSFLAGKEFEIQARAFKTVGEDTTYAGAVKQKITYTVTAEPDRD